ncbi:aldose 1-epimerase [Noviherbaspirillum denitrificans]|uniref:Galactose-1-epimerase n=1 Tax=Noviherbaspirillum denitrificans TaxID=1968433 RepID=A0A254THQ1_9BURK|nr:aldose 1-epimerase [Noviherbaspirillum denitrificans]OWW22161.1 galactose-1-epimerase [Noviherbaspirillum denitrificans]
MTAELITLENDVQYLQLTPEMGGGVTAWNWKNDGSVAHLFRPWDGGSGDRYSLACFPLVPWANRITQGGFEFEGKFHQIHTNRTEEHFPIHGSGWLQPWQVAERGEGRIRLSLESRSFDGNPYHYRSTQTFLLLADGLQIDLTVTNLGTATMPFGLGLHPYFVRNGQTRLMFKASGVWLHEKDPTAIEFATTFPPTWDYNQGGVLDGPMIDACYTGWNGKAVIEYPDRRLSITMVMPDCNGYVVFHRPADSDFFSLEPVTHPSDAFHMPDQPGLVYLTHGDSFALRTKFLVGPLTA